MTALHQFGIEPACTGHKIRMRLHRPTDLLEFRLLRCTQMGIQKSHLG